MRLLNGFQASPQANDFFLQEWQDKKPEAHPLGLDWILLELVQSATNVGSNRAIQLKTLEFRVGIGTSSILLYVKFFWLLTNVHF